MPEYTEEDIKTIALSTPFTVEQIIKAVKFYENELARWKKCSTERYYKLHPKKEKAPKAPKEDVPKRSRGRPRKNPIEIPPVQNAPENNPATPA